MSDLDDRMEQQIARMQARQREKRIAAEAEHRDRRERIATEAMKALLSGPLPDKSTYEQVTRHAVYCADALIAELDKEVQP